MPSFVLERRVEGAPGEEMRNPDASARFLLLEHHDRDLGLIWELDPNFGDGET